MNPGPTDPKQLNYYVFLMASQTYLQIGWFCRLLFSKIPFQDPAHLEGSGVALGQFWVGATVLRIVRIVEFSQVEQKVKLTYMRNPDESFDPCILNNSSPVAHVIAIFGIVSKWDLSRWSFKYR